MNKKNKKNVCLIGEEFNEKTGQGISRVCEECI